MGNSGELIISQSIFFLDQDQVSSVKELSRTIQAADKSAALVTSYAGTVTSYAASVYKLRCSSAGVVDKVAAIVLVLLSVVRLSAIPSSLSKEK